MGGFARFNMDRFDTPIVGDSYPTASRNHSFSLFNRSAHSAGPGKRLKEDCWLASGALTLPEMCRGRNQEDLRFAQLNQNELSRAELN